MYQYIYVELEILLTDGSEDFKENIIAKYEDNILLNTHLSNDFYDIFDIVSDYFKDSHHDCTIESISLFQDYGNDWDDDLDPDIIIENLDSSIDFSDQSTDSQDEEF